MREPLGMSPPPVGRIAMLAMKVRDLDRAVTFYVDALGFRVEARAADSAELAIGSERITLVARPDARPYPSPRAANDPWFQHFAIAVGDITAAYAQLSRFPVEPISQGGPQLLPPSTGSVTAYKFRDPDGHPLELSYAPGSAWLDAGTARGGSVFLGIDHTALAVRDLEASIAFYAGLGFSLGGRFLNQGPEQERLDGLTDAVVDIVTLVTPEPGPHIELLHYRSPSPVASRGVAPDDIAATETILATRRDGTRTEAPSISRLTDPDGHLLRFIS